MYVLLSFTSTNLQGSINVSQCGWTYLVSAHIKLQYISLPQEIGRSLTTLSTSHCTNVSRPGLYTNERSVWLGLYHSLAALCTQTDPLPIVFCDTGWFLCRKEQGARSNTCELAVSELAVSFHVFYVFSEQSLLFFLKRNCCFANLYLHSSFIIFLSFFPRTKTSFLIITISFPFFSNLISCFWILQGKNIV